MRSSWMRRCSAELAEGACSAGRLRSSTYAQARSSMLCVVATRTIAVVARRTTPDVAGSDSLGDTGSVGPISVGVRHDAAHRRPDRRPILCGEARRHLR